MFARLFLISLLLVAVSVGATVQKERARVERIGDMPNRTIVFDDRLTAEASADTCYARSDVGEYWAINGWVTGNELYKKYLDPTQSCEGPYPYQVTEINMMMVFDAAVTFDASVDIELADLSDPNCPAPGALVAISSSYSVPVPGAGLYNIWIPLDSPVTVTEPFFAGYYLGSAIDPSAGAAVVTDTIPVECQAWNIWDTAVGFVSLDTSWGFPGGLVLYAAGIPGGGGGTPQPDPIIKFCMPANGDSLLGSARLWAEERSGSKIIDYVSFQYWNGSSYTEIGRDYSGNRPIRDGVNVSGVGDGWSIDWDFGAMSEGMMKLKVMAIDTMGRTSEDSITVFLEPTPPVPNITVPYSGAVVCAPVNFAYSVMDDNLQTISMYSKTASTNYVAPITLMSQTTVGDNNGNPNDNNLAANGEFGDYYCAPVAAAMALRLWKDKGYNALMMAGATSMTMQAVAESLATRFGTRAYKGSYDERVITGIRDYANAASVPLSLTYTVQPSYNALRIAAEEQEQTVLLAIGGAKGLWLTLVGFTGWVGAQSSYYLKLADPTTGTSADYQYRVFSGQPMLFYGSSWKSIDGMLAFAPKSWNATRTSLGADNNGSDGWMFGWSPSGITNGTHVYVRAEGTDATSQHGSSTVLLTYDCSQAFGAGDYNGDGSSNISDLAYLIAFISNGGPAPSGGGARGDANCDGRVNIADVVYYMNYLFGGVGAPCR